MGIVLEGVQKGVVGLGGCGEGGAVGQYGCGFWNTWLGEECGVY